MDGRWAAIEQGGISRKGGEEVVWHVGEFAEKRRGKELNGAFASTTVSCAVGKGRNSLRVNTDKGVAGEGWNKGRSASCVGDYLSS